MSSERTDPDVPGGRDDHGWAPSRPSAVPQGSELLIDRMVLAVRAGDDPAIRGLLARLAQVADVAVLLRLRQRLDEDVHGRPGSDGQRTPVER
ncbi:hypothetical protein [Streptomyces sp. NBC_01568]|uniref:hypothetical protein n=1 Tax=Streptomyces sp. NBC_01568 TaxID=2975882 RepID=UPI003864E44B